MSKKYERLVTFLNKENIKFDVMEEEQEWIFFIKKEILKPEDDYNSVQLGKLLEAWSFCFNEKPMTVNDVFRKADNDLLKVIHEVCGELNGRALGRWIKRNSNRIMHGLKFVESDVLRRSIAWKVVEV